MTKSMITLPSERYEIYERQLAEKDAEILKLSNEKDAEIANNLKEIAELKRQLEEALGKNK